MKCLTSLFSFIYGMVNDLSLMLCHESLVINLQVKMALMLIHVPHLTEPLSLTLLTLITATHQPNSYINHFVHTCNIKMM